eukprot:m.562415 g.562415  ORF g.562415 m.562415 type:complete len:394 (-) comp22222_c0_seq5:1295-2476(-)
MGISTRDTDRHLWTLVCVLLVGQLFMAVPTVNAKVSIQQTAPVKLEKHPDGDVTAVVLAAIGRTGSTMLSGLLRELPSAFVLVEPYKNFFVINRSDRKSAVKSVHERGIHSPPLLSSLLDCSFAAAQPLLDVITWGFLCEQSTLVDPTYEDGFKTRCRNGTITEEDRRNVLHFCQKSRFRVVKTIRLAFLPESVRESVGRLTPANGYQLRTIHILRHPFKVLVAQYNHAWYDVLQIRQSCRQDAVGDSVARTMCDRLPLTDVEGALAVRHLSRLAPHICSLYTNTTRAIHSGAMREGSRLLRYEDLVQPYTIHTFTAVAQLLHIPEIYPDVDLDAIATTAATKRFAAFRITDQEYRESHTDYAAHDGTVQRRMAVAPQCAQLYADMGYDTWPP